MFVEAKPFTGFTEGCQKESVLPLLLALVNMILEGPTITDHYEETTPAALSIAQLFESSTASSAGGKNPPLKQSLYVCHSAAQETPVPTYICRTDVTWSYMKEGVGR